MGIVKRLAQSIREYKQASILTPIFVAIEVVFETLMPLVVVLFISVIEKGDTSKMFMYGGVLTLLAIGAVTCGILSGKQCAKASCGFAKNLRKDLFDSVQDFSFENVDKFSSSSLVTRLTTDVNNVQQAYMMIIRIAVRCPLTIIFSMIMAFLVNSSLPFVFVTMIPILAFGLIILIRKVMPLFKELFKRYDNLNNSVQENVKGIRVVKAYVREQYEIDKFTNSARDLKDDFTRAERIIALNNPLMTFCAYSSMLLLGFFGARIIIDSGATALDIEGIGALLTYSITILSSLMMLSMVFVMITISQEGAKRIYEVLTETSNIKDPENPITDVKNGDIEFKNVSFKYAKTAEKYALSDIDLKIKSGETIGILGGTGSSKTTLVNLISRLYDVTEGELLVGGVNVKDYSLVSLRDAVSVVLQKNVLFSGTIKENLKWGNENATDSEIEFASKLAEADEFIQKFPDKYETVIDQGGSNVSGGQKQRLCIARALLKNPKVIILDDSTSAVDTKTDAKIRMAFSKYLPNTTKIIISQRISSIENADKIIVMENGKINGVGTHKELISSNEIYKEINSIQNKIGSLEGGKN